MKVQLISPLPDAGFAYNQGIYWPVGLLAIGSLLRRRRPDVELELLDEAIDGAVAGGRLDADIVGIQASSSMTYANTLRIAREARNAGAHVVLGGPFASEVPGQILRHRPTVDAVVVGAGEGPLIDIVDAVDSGADLTGIPGVWTRHNGQVVDGGRGMATDYERCLPLDYDLVAVDSYHDNYRQRLNPGFWGSFQIFTHFGCRYRDLRRRQGKSWCSYCALSSRLLMRSPGAVLEEIRDTLERCGVESGARVMLKCYGDNATALGGHLDRLADTLTPDPLYRRYDIRWSMYAQSSWVTPSMVETMRRLRVGELYIGFDAVDDAVQLRNGLGTSRQKHLRAAELLAAAGIRIHAGFVLGCAGESPETVEATVDFARELSRLGNTDMYHASPLVVLPGSPAFEMLQTEVPSLHDTDFFDTEGLQVEWLTRFCPDLGSAGEALRRLERASAEIADLGRIPSSFGGWRERDEPGGAMPIREAS